MDPITPYARYLNALRTLRRDHDEASREGCDELLAYLLESLQKNRVITMNDLVYTRDFGTSPTIQRKVRSLADRDLVKVLRTDKDKRARIIEITQQGIKHLESQSQFVQEIFCASKG